MAFVCRVLPLALLPLSYAAVVTYNFNATWVTANPDGAYPRPVIGLNGQWPMPYIEATVGDNVIVNLNNQLGNQSTSLHFHGMFMNGTANMDGAVGATQCHIPPGHSFQYNFTVRQPGTYWYHSHSNSQYPDGMRAPLIIHDPDSPFKGQYDEERVLTLSDWYHDQMQDLLKSFINRANPTGAEPVPNAALMNDTQNLTTMVEPGKTYMFRIVNVAAFAAQYLWFEGHTMRIVEVDGVYTEPAETDLIYITAAQRYSVLVTTKNDTSTNYAFVGSMDQDLFDTVPATLNPNVTGWLVYNGKTDDRPEPTPLDEFDPFDDFTLIPKDGAPLLPEPDYTVPLTMKMDNLGDGANYAFFNDVSYIAPRVPSIFTALSTGANASNPAIYARETNAFVLEKDQVVEIILNNNDPGKHPFHLHGHNFQVIVRSDEEAGDYVYNETFPAVPMRRDTIMARPNGNFVIRFRADNPGVWLFHCHIEWHMATGLIATMIEAPAALQASGLTSPADHIEACAADHIPTAGNAVGNTVNLLDLTGATHRPAPLPAGFTAKGIVALTFSIICGLLGLAVISWYGLGEIKDRNHGAAGLGKTVAIEAEKEDSASR